MRGRSLWLPVLLVTGSGHGGLAIMLIASWLAASVALFALTMLVTSPVTTWIRRPGRVPDTSIPELQEPIPPSPESPGKRKSLLWSIFWNAVSILLLAGSWFFLRWMHGVGHVLSWPAAIAYLVPGWILLIVVVLLIVGINLLTRLSNARQLHFGLISGATRAGSLQKQGVKGVLSRLQNTIAGLPAPSGEALVAWLAHTLNDLAGLEPGPDGRPTCRASAAEWRGCGSAPTKVGPTCS